MIDHELFHHHRHCDKLMFNRSHGNAFTTSGLDTHLNKCRQYQLKGNPTLSLEGFNFKSGTGPQPLDKALIRYRLMSWNVQACLPMHGVDHPEFRALISHAWPALEKAVPHRRALADDIKLFYGHMQEVLKARLADHVGGVYIGIDGWTSRTGEHYFGQVLYYLDRETKSRKSFLLALTRQVGGISDIEPFAILININVININVRSWRAAQSGSNLAKVVNETITKYGIRDKVSSHELAYARSS